ncbi:hypothetical protein C8J56DRAFT_851127 [Mycena floridula]|nr:hypothetical protein C8J56DRAFT_851127 [Mycena floridula]
MSHDKDASRLQGHVSRTSFDSNIAESAISFSGLASFPAPPASIPNTPVHSSFPNTPTRADFGDIKSSPVSSIHASHYRKPVPPTAPLVPQRKPGPSSSKLRNEPRAASPASLSPYDWHDGASSIDVDAAEDRLLSTSFITSLLRENGDSQTRRSSVASDAISGISEMTYPPTSRFDHSNDRPPTIPHPPLPQYKPLRGGRPRPAPPTSFSPIPETSGQHDASDDSDTLYSNQDHYFPTLVRSASVQRRAIGLQGASVAPATLRSISGSSRDASVQAARESSVNELDTGQIAYHVQQSYPFSPALPSTAGSQLHFLRDKSSSNTSQPDARQSVHSTKSFAPSFVSKISSVHRSLGRIFGRQSAKPLPPVPAIPHISVAAEREHRRAEAAMPLPDLMARAGALNGMLEKGYHPHESLTSYYHGNVDLAKSEAVSSGFEEYRDDDDWLRRPQPSGPLSPSQTWVSPDTALIKGFPPQPKKPRNKKVIPLVIAFIIIALIAIGAGVGVTLRRKTQSVPNCAGEFTGAACNLNATCVCTSSVSSRCDGLARNIIDLTGTMNTLFHTNYSVNAVYIAVWSAQGSVTESSCSSQSLLIDVAPGLISGNLPNRTTWAEAALLWNLVQSQDTDSVGSLQQFVVKAPWSQLASSDGPVDDPLSTFSTSASGFTFDFASQVVTQQSVSFVNNGQPSDDQNSRVGSTAHNTLDRMYSFALASSTQREGALSTYWSSVLQQTASDLAGFLSRLAASPIILPFDATSQTISNLYGPSSPFPPPLSCHPGLTATQLQRINAVEVDVFGLQSVASAPKSFDPSCYADRPVYGVLDVLHLRLPFLDSRTGLAKQGVILNPPVGPRAVLHSGELLSALPASINDTVITTVQSDPRQYGTLNHLNHVVLNYLQSMDVPVAIALVKYVLAGSGIPPTTDAIPSAYLATIPPLEVAIFGSVLPADISTTVSSFSAPSGALFFGSTQGQLLRQWSVNTTGHTLIWSDGAIAPLVAHDPSVPDSTFNTIWVQAATAIQKSISVTVSQITSSLQSNGKLSQT